MVLRDSIKFFSSNAVESLMTKYLLFIIVFLLSFMINITVSRGETVKNIKMNGMDVYYKKTKIFRNWDKKGLNISKRENKLLLLYPEQMIKPEPMIKKKINPLPVVQASEAKVIRILIQGTIKLETPEAIEKRSTPVADSILNSYFKPGISEKEKKLLLLHTEPMIKKKEIKSLPAVQASEAKVIRILIQGTINLEPPEVSKKTLTPVADSILNLVFKPVKAKEKLQIAEKENKALIYGNDFERDCYLNKKDCGFSIYKEVKQYSNKISSQKERVDTTRFPIDFQAN